MPDPNPFDSLRADQSSHDPDATPFASLNPSATAPTDEASATPYGTLNPSAGSQMPPVDALSAVGTETASYPPAAPPSKPTDTQVRSPAPETTLDLTPDDPGEVATVTTPEGVGRVLSSRPAEASGGPVVPGYELLGVLGKGGMGIVYKARHRELNRVVALKMIRDASMADEDDLARFRIEAQAIAAMQHPNIVQIYEIGTYDGLPYFSLEFVDGGSLHGKLAKTPQPVRWSAEMMETIARAMFAAHSKKIIHRDLKPANVLITKEGTPKITDFGLAKQLDAETEQTRSGAIMGTPNYMSPEQAEGKTAELGPLTDVWALGVMLYEMLTGRLPFLGESVMDTLILIRTAEPVPPRQLQPKLPADVQTICLKCLEKDSTKRYASAGDLADDLRRYLNGEPIVARPASSLEKLVKLARRRKAATAAVLASVAALLFLVVGTILVQYQGNRILQNELNETRRFEAQRGDVERLLAEGQERVADQKWADAKVSLDSALNLIGDEDRLGDQKKRADELLVQTSAGLERLADQQRRVENGNRFLVFDNQWNLYNSQFTGLDVRENRAKAGAACVAALGIYNWQRDADPGRVRGDLYLDEAKQRRLLDAGSQMLFFLAREALQEEKSLEGARRALQLVENAGRLRGQDREYHDMRADCFAALNDPKSAAEERAAADNIREEISRNQRPGSASDYFLLAQRQYRQNDLDGAATLFNAALREQPNHYWAQFYRAICYLRVHKPEAAAESLTGCLERGQDTQDLIWIYLMRGFAHGEIADQLRRSGPKKGEAEAALYAKAAEYDFTQAERMKPSDDERYVLLVNRGVIRSYVKGDGRAIADLEAAVALKPERFQAYNNLAHVYGERGDFDKARAMLDKAIALKPSVLSSLYRARAKLEIKRGAGDAALADLDLALKTEAADSPFRADDQLERGQVLRSQKKLPEALGAFDAALQLRPSFAKAHRHRAVALMESRRYDEAIKAFDNYLEHVKGPAGAEVYQAIGLNHQMLGNYSGAIDNFTRALAIKDDVKSRTERGWAYLVNDVPRLALRDFQAALDQSPDSADAYAGRGLARAKVGKHAEAVADAEEALRRGPKDARTPYNAARVYAQAVARLDETKGPRSPLSADIRKQYEDRAIALLETALESLPTKEAREEFWFRYVKKDNALNPIRRTRGFSELAKKYGKATSVVDAKKE